MGPIAVISNLNCRANRRDPSIALGLRRALGDEGLFFTTHDEGALLDAAERCAKAGASIIAIHGGDGTLHLTLTRLIHAYGRERLPPVAFLRGGTQNTVANACGITRDPEPFVAALARARRRKAHLAHIERDILRLGPAPTAEALAGPHEARDDLYGFIFGNGFVYQFLEEYYGRGVPSRWNALATLAVGCASVAVRGEVARRMFRRFRGRVIVDGTPWPATDYTGVVGSTIEQVGLGFRPFVRCDERPGAFHLLGITTGALGFAMELPSIRLGLPLNDRKILNGVHSHVVFEGDEPLKYIIDGDARAAAHRLELGVGPRLRLVVPPARG